MRDVRSKSKNPTSKATNGHSRAASAPTKVRASYDAAKTTTGNANHWLNADHLSASASNTEAVRRQLRSRGRYEAANNSWLWGMVDTIVEDTLGTGARLQIRSGKKRSSVDEQVEAAYAAFHLEEEIDDKANILRRSKIETGEVFGMLTRGHLHRRRGSTLSMGENVELGVQILEADQCMTPQMDYKDPRQVSGIEYDAYGKPTFYHILDHHPGDMGWTALTNKDMKRVPADLVIHYFNPRRPGDARGIPEVTPALPLFALLRRMTLATVESSEHIANIAGMLQTDAPADGDVDDSVDTLDVIDFERGSIMTLPHGWKYHQADPKQPNSTYEAFRDAILNEIARTLKLPFNVAAGNSSGYNYASGRLDFQAYHRAIRVERSRMIRIFYDRIFWAWFDEASRISGLLPAEARTASYRESLRTRWFFDGFGHVDPVKEAQGERLRLENGTTTLSEECAAQGRDWREVLEQRAEEYEYAESLGIPPIPSSASSSKKNDDEKDEEEEETNPSSNKEGARR